MRPITVSTVEGLVVAERALATASWLERARGWIGKTQAEPGEGLLLDPASSIHTFGMRFSMDLVFMDDFGKVLKLCPGMKPSRVAFGPLMAWLKGEGLQALELPAGTLAALEIQVGQTLSIKNRTEGKRRA